MMTNSYQLDRSWSDVAISAARSAWYRVTESRRLTWARRGWVDSDIVTVLIPTFNRVELLMKRAIPSVLMQTHDRTLAVVLAHGCTDGTKDAVDQLRSPRVFCIPVKRTRQYPPTAENHWLMGPTEPLNHGLRRRHQGWIARMDDDDIWSAEHIQRQIEFSRAGDFEFVSCGHYANGIGVHPYIMRDGTKIGGCQTWLYRSYLRMFRYNPASWRKSWNRNNDTDLQDRMWRAGVRMGYRPHGSVFIDPRPGETQIGSAVYKLKANEVEKKYAFR